MSTLTGVLAMGRAQAEARMTETLTFFYETMADPPEGQIDPVLAEIPVHADIPGQIKFHTVQVSDREQAGQLIGVQQLMVKVVVGATPNVRTDHFVRVTASTVDSTIVGRKFRISGMPQSGQVTASRYPLEEVS